MKRQTCRVLCDQPANDAVDDMGEDFGPRQAGQAITDAANLEPTIDCEGDSQIGRFCPSRFERTEQKRQVWADRRRDFEDDAKTPETNGAQSFVWGQDR